MKFNTSIERGLLVLFLIFNGLILGVACTKKPAKDPSQMTEAELAARGKTVYQSNCIACHNADPSKDGAIGPAIKGSSKELVEAKVLRNEYPAGYTPKRQTKAMAALPHLSNEILAITSFLNSAENP